MKIKIKIKITQTITTFIVFAFYCTASANTTPDSTHNNKVVNGGIKLQTNSSNFIMNIPSPGFTSMTSNMNIGAELGGFMNFNVSKHCIIQFNLLLVSEQQNLNNAGKHDQLWTLGLEIPLYILGRYGNHQQGYFLFGGGPYTEFSLWARMNGDTNGRNPYHHVVDTSADGESIFALSDNHSGLAVYLGYEFSFGLQINAAYQASFSNILNINNNAAYCHPQKITLGIGYRFK